jgi:hypothetical protein
LGIGKLARTAAASLSILSVVFEEPRIHHPTALYERKYEHMATAGYSPEYIISLPSGEMLKFGLLSSLFHLVGTCTTSFKGGALVFGAAILCTLERRLLLGAPALVPPPPSLPLLSSDEYGIGILRREFWDRSKTVVVPGGAIEDRRDAGRWFGCLLEPEPMEFRPPEVDSLLPPTPPVAPVPLVLISWECGWENEWASP